MVACARRATRSPARKPEEAAMTNRRQFLQASAAVGGGLALEFSLTAPALAQAGAAAPVEVTHWLVIHPDERIVIRIARSEMGQGSLTGLAQLVAEELACDWSKVTTEYPTPGQNLARNQVWGDFRSEERRVGKGGRYGEWWDE